MEQAHERYLIEIIRRLDYLNGALGGGGSSTGTGGVGLATAVNQVAMISLLTDIKNKLCEADELETGWVVDATGTVYWLEIVRDEATNTTSYVYYDAPGGTIQTPTGQVTPLFTPDKEVIPDCYVIKANTAASTEYTVGDEVKRYVIVDVTANPPTTAQVWYNVTTDTILTAPPNILDLQPCSHGKDRVLISEEVIPFDDTAVKTLTPPPDANLAELWVKDGEIMYRLFSNPSNAIHIPVCKDTPFELESATEIANFKFKGMTGNTGNLIVYYYAYQDTNA